MKAQNIQHLFWRAGFGLSPSQWQERQYWSISQAVDDLFRSAELAEKRLNKTPFATPLVKNKKALSTEEKAVLRKEKRRLARLHCVDWLLAMGEGKESDLLNKMTLFWHGHFACTSKVGSLAYNQLLTLKKHALGNFKDLVIAIAKDPSMVRFLNNQKNRKNSPNENFARELMELFTIGRGNYTEQDVKAAARAFTGWSSSTQGEFFFRSRQHDYGPKQFMGQNGNFDGTDIIDIILSKRETATFICRKIYGYFVNSRINEQRVEQLATVFYNSGYDIALLMRTIFLSDWFYDAQNQQIKIKSPAELLAGIIRQLDLKINNKIALFGIQKALGQTLFDPPNVAGWSEGKGWIDNATLMLRLSLPQAIFYAAELNMKEKDDLEGKGSRNKIRKLQASANLQPIIRSINTDSKEIALEQLSQYLLANNSKGHQESLNRFTDKQSKETFIKSLTMRLMMLPEYQLC